MKTLSASEFKATCMAVLDRVARTGERVIVTKRGRPVVQVVPAMPASDDALPQQRIMGKIEVVGDIVGPVLPPDTWNALRGAGE